MLHLQKLIKPWSESASLNAHINLYGFWSENTFLTKTGDLGMVLSVAGVDYESLDQAEQQYAVKRLESAFKSFGDGFRIYQYLFKTNRPDIPFAHYGDPLIDAAIEQRREFFEDKRDRLYEVGILYVVILEGPHSKPGFFRSLGRLATDPRSGYADLQAQFSSDGMKTLVLHQLDTTRVKLEQRVEQFLRQTADLCAMTVLDRDKQFTFFRRLVNFDHWRIAGKPQSTQYLDFQVVNSDIEAERDHLRVGDHFVRTLTMKEAVGETRPMVLDQLLKIEANFYVCTEWVPMATGKARREVDKRRKHFNMAKSGFISQMRDPTTSSARDVLIDESKQADVENLGDCMRALGEGQLLGDFSLTVVLYAPQLETIERSIGEFAGIFTNRDGALFAETYNQLNAFFAVVPGNTAHNLRKLYLLLSNYADLSFLFTIHPGERTNPQLASEYLAVMETDNATPYFLNLHNGEVAHTLILGMTGSGKSTLIFQLLHQIQERGEVAIIHDPAGEFIKKFFDKERGDIVLNPLDDRMPYWGPSEELRTVAEALTLAKSLYQPTDKNRKEFFTEGPQEIFAKMLETGASPHKLAEWMASEDEIDKICAGTHLAKLIPKDSPNQRNGTLGSLGLVAKSFKLLPTEEEAGGRTWAASEWVEKRQGWIFMTSRPTERDALRPLQSLWIDWLVLLLLNEPRPDQKPVWFVLDELASLQRLPQLHTAITENRKSKNPLILGFQGKGQMDEVYGNNMAEVMLSQPATKIFLKTTEPKAAEWISDSIGKVEIERVKETHTGGNNAHKNYTLDRQIDPLVMSSEISGLENLHAFLKLGNNVVQFHFDHVSLPDKATKFIPRFVKDDQLRFKTKQANPAPPDSIPASPVPQPKPAASAPAIDYQAAEEQEAAKRPELLEKSGHDDPPIEMTS